MIRLTSQWYKSVVPQPLLLLSVQCSICYTLNILSGNRLCVTWYFFLAATTVDVMTMSKEGQAELLGVLVSFLLW